MYSPNIWNLRPPPFNKSTIIINKENGKKKLSQIISQHHFNYCATILIPEMLRVPEKVSSSITVDCEYYKFKNVTLDKFVDYHFRCLFIKSGNLYAISIDNRLDVDNCFCITPNGFLVLNLQKEFYKSVGLENGPAITIQQYPDTLLVRINLLNDSFIPGKKNYIRAVDELKKISGSFIVMWQPNDETICPSSIAAYFNNFVTVEECSLLETKRTFYNIKMPLLSGEDLENVIEWFGAACLGINPINENDTTAEYLSSFTHPEEFIEIGQVAVQNWQGFLPNSKIMEIVNLLIDWITIKTNKSLWVGLNVQGFDDAPITWNFEKHHYNLMGDNSYTILIDSSGNIYINKILTTNIKKSKKS